MFQFNQKPVLFDKSCGSRQLVGPKKGAKSSLLRSQQQQLNLDKNCRCHLASVESLDCSSVAVPQNSHPYVSFIAKKKSPGFSWWRFLPFLGLKKNRSVKPAGACHSAWCFFAFHQLVHHLVQEVQIGVQVKWHLTVLVSTCCRRFAMPKNPPIFFGPARASLCCLATRNPSNLHADLVVLLVNHPWSSDSWELKSHVWRQGQLLVNCGWYSLKRCGTENQVGCRHSPKSCDQCLVNAC